MYKCNCCGRDFEQLDTVYESDGRGWCVCPHCRSEDFGRYRNLDDRFLYIEKCEALEFIVTSIAFINEGDTDRALDVLSDFICAIAGVGNLKLKKKLYELNVLGSGHLLDEVKKYVEIAQNLQTV